MRSISARDLNHDSAGAEPDALAENENIAHLLYTPGIEDIPLTLEARNLWVIPRSEEMKTSQENWKPGPLDSMPTGVSPIPTFSRPLGGNPHPPQTIREIVAMMDRNSDRMATDEEYRRDIEQFLS